MAENVNRVVLTGNLTRDPDYRETPSGVKVCNLRLAVNERQKQGDTWGERANFFDVTVFGTQGANVNQYLKKGAPVAIDGRLRWREWETDTGDKRQAVSIIADSVQFLGTGKRDDTSSPADVPADTADLAPAAASAEDDDIPF